MKLKVFLFCVAILMVIAPAHAKKVTLGNYFYYDGDYNKSAKMPSGAGSLVMYSNGNSFTDADGNKDYGVTDMLAGTFNGTHVSNALLVFSSSWSFEGSVDYEINTSLNDGESIRYTLYNGKFTSRYPYKSNGRVKATETVLTIAEDSVIIERFINNDIVTVKSGVMVNNTKSGPLYFGRYIVAGLLGIDEIYCTKKERIEASTKISDLIHLEENTQRMKQQNQKRQQNNGSLNPFSGLFKSIKAQTVSHIGTRYAESWDFVTVDESYCDKEGKSIVAKKNNEVSILKYGENEVRYNSEKLLSAHRVYDDCVFSYSNTVATVKYTNGDVYQGKVYSQWLNNGGLYNSESTLLQKIVTEKSFSKSGIDPFDGVKTFADGTTEKFSFGHSHKSITKESVVGIYEVSCGQYPSFDNMKFEGTIQLFEDNTYQWTIEQKTYGSETDLAVFRTSYRCGKWNILNNQLVLTETPEKNQFSCKAYPSRSNRLTQSQIEQLRAKYVQEANDQYKKTASSGSSSFAFDIVEQSRYSLKFFIGNISYKFAKKEGLIGKIQPSQIVGRWAVPAYDEIYDFNSDGTYRSYNTDQIMKSDWTESFTVCQSGKWILDNQDFILICDPTKAEVQAKVVNPRNSALARVPARNKELLQMAVSKQAEHRKNDNIYGVLGRMIEVSDNVLTIEARGIEFRFIRMAK